MLYLCDRDTQSVVLTFDRSREPFHNDDLSSPPEERSVQFRIHPATIGAYSLI
jgi:hypothetical protein